MSDAATLKPIPIPHDFPVNWEQPDDAHALWERELQHLPGQSTALDESLVRRIGDKGFNAACEDFSMPIRNAYRRLNTYVYQSIAPVSHDHAVLEGLGREAQERLGAAIGRQRELWDGERLPEIKSLLARWRAFDSDGATDAELVAHVRDSVAWCERAWHIHFQTVFPVLVSMSLFADLYAELLGDGDPYGAYRLLQGQDNESLRVNRELYALSREAADSVTVRAVLDSTRASEVVAALGTSTEGQAFLDRLDAFLQDHGRRSTLYITVSAPSYIEDPTPLIVSLQDAITQPKRDDVATLAAAAHDRELLTASARERLGSFPEPVRGQFEFLLSAAQQGSVMQEDHNYWIDTQVTYEVRQVMLAVGRRLVANGCLDRADDVFHLTVEDLDDLSTDRRAGVAAQKAELERFRDVAAPRFLGVFPPGPRPDDPISRAVTKMFGGEPAESGSASILNGMAGSPGVAQGRVRLVHALADGEQLQHGEVLVAPTTAPPWTPLFARAAAIVTDTGGILSHCAVVAREYEIPAVVGVRRAMATLRNGQLIEVDGTNGTVRIVEE